MSKLLIFSSILLAKIGAQSMKFFLPILCESQRNKKTIETQTLVNNRAGGDFLHQDFAIRHKINLLPLDTLIILQNIDGTLNKGGKITYYVYVDILFNNQRIGTVTCHFYLLLFSLFDLCLTLRYYHYSCLLSSILILILWSSKYTLFSILYSYFVSLFAYFHILYYVSMFCWLACSSPVCVVH